MSNEIEKLTQAVKRLQAENALLQAQALEMHLLLIEGQIESTRQQASVWALLLTLVAPGSPQWEGLTPDLIKTELERLQETELNLLEQAVAEGDRSGREIAVGMTDGRVRLGVR